MKKTSISKSIFHNFKADLGPQLGAKLAHLGAMLGFLAPLGAALGDLGRLLGSRMLSRRPWSLPDPSQTSIFNDFASIFGRISEDFLSFFFVFPAVLQRSRSARWRLCARSALDIIRRHRVAGQAVRTSCVILVNFNGSNPSR